MEQKPHPDAADGHPFEAAAQDNVYIAFPGGIPKRWFDPAFNVFITVFLGYTLWVVVAEFREGETSGASPVVIAKSIVTHLSNFFVVFTLVLIAFCKGLERIMYYLDAKKQAAQYKQQAEQYKQRAEQAEQYKQRAEKAEQYKQRAEKAEAEKEHLLQELQRYKQNRSDA